MAERKKRIENAIKIYKNYNLTDDEIDDLGVILFTFFSEDEYNFYRQNIEKFI